MSDILHWSMGRDRFTSCEIKTNECEGITYVFFSIPDFYIEGCVSFSAMNTEIETKGSYTVLVDVPETHAISIVGSTSTEQWMIRFKGVWFAPAAPRNKGAVEIFLARTGRSNTRKA